MNYIHRLRIPPRRRKDKQQRISSGGAGRGQRAAEECGGRESVWEGRTDADLRKTQKNDETLEAFHGISGKKDKLSEKRGGHHSERVHRDKK